MLATATQRPMTAATRLVIKMIRDQVADLSWGPATG
jgi:hypothetical protein